MFGSRRARGARSKGSGKGRREREEKPEKELAQGPVIFDENERRIYGVRDRD